MRRKTGHVFLVLFREAGGVLRQTQVYGWAREDELGEIAGVLARDESADWSGFVPFAKGIESSADRGRLARHLWREQKSLLTFTSAEPGEPYLFPRVACEKHGPTRIRFLACSACGHVEDIEAAPEGPQVLECPGGCGAPFTPMADPHSFTARALCLKCGQERIEAQSCRHEGPSQTA